MNPQLNGGHSHENNKLKTCLFETSYSFKDELVLLLQNEIIYIVQSMLTVCSLITMMLQIQKTPEITQNMKYLKTIESESFAQQQI